MFFFRDDKAWIISSVIAAVAAMWFGYVYVGCRLWVKRLSVGLGIRWTLTKTTIGILLASCLIYGLVFVLNYVNLNMALKSAVKKSIDIDWKKERIKRSWKLERDKDATLNVKDFMRVCKVLSKNDEFKRLRDSFPSRSHWTKTTFHLNEDINLIAPDVQRKVADFILDNPEMIELNKILKDALTKPVCRVFNLYACVRLMRNYLVNRAYALLFRGENKAFFNTLDDIRKLGFWLAPSQMTYYDYINVMGEIERTMSIACVAGPDSRDALGHYERMIKELSWKPKIVFKEGLRLLETVHTPSMVMDDYRYRDPQYRWSVIAVYLNFSRLWQSAASWFRWYEEKIKIANAILNDEGFSAIKALHQQVYEDRGKVYGIFRDDTNIYWEERDNSLVAFAIVLALKEFKIRHGEFPDSLDELNFEETKGMLLDELNFVYKKEEEGFLLQGFRSLFIRKSFQFCHIRYYPWCPQADEDTKKASE